MNDAVRQVRQFNRTVTEQVGALQDHYLSRQRSLGAARVLWEIGHDGREIRELRSRLGLDSGYLSRLLRSLEHDGLIAIASADSDKRVRTAHLTTKGATEWDLLDRRSDALARSLLEPLTHSQRQRLVEAMAEVDQLLTAATIRLDDTDPSSGSARYCLEQYFAELHRRFEDGFDPAASIPADAEDMRPPAGVFVVATLRRDPVGCGALKFHGDEPTEVKRMWVAPSARGLGLGRRLLVELEARAAAKGTTTLRLETNRALTEAIALYRSSGYREVPAFNDEPYAHHWFEKHLSPRATEPRTASDDATHTLTDNPRDHRRRSAQSRLGRQPGNT